MEIQINYLNSDRNKNSNEPTWHSRWKTYKSDWMDEDMKNSTVSQQVDRIIINDAQLTSRESVDDMIEFLTKARESFRKLPVVETEPIVEKPLTLDEKYAKGKCKSCDTPNHRETRHMCDRCDGYNCYTIDD